MANLENSKDKRTFEAIVIGSGMTGGWVAKELTDQGIKTLMLDRGREVKHIRDYTTAHLFPYEQEHRGRITQKMKEENPIASTCHAFTEDKHHLFVKDKEHPYIQDKPFEWIRGYQSGGRSLMWGRQVQRWSEFDFEGPARDGFAVDWPIRYKDLAPWYSHVERFIGVSGSKDGLSELPDGEFLPPMELSAGEMHLQQSLKANYKNRHLIIGRCAHITGNYEFYKKQGRGGCQHRDECRRGCPLGGYFSSNASTIPWALKSGNLTVRHHAVVHSILYDESKERAKGVVVFDAETKERTEYYAQVVFLNAGSLNSNLILLNSKSNRFPQGLGNDNGLLGKYIAFHNYRGRVSATFDGLKEYRTEGRRPTGAYMPRFRNVFRQETEFLRGYATSMRVSRSYDIDKSSIGLDLKEALLNPTYGPWKLGAGMMGETIPKESNSVTLDPEQKDDWGIPLLRVNVDYDENDDLMVQDFMNEFQEMLDQAGFRDITVRDSHRPPGSDIHEMGGVRMGADPKTSLLNKWNQLHACPNVIVSDGACMTSTSTQNPSLTYMSIAARATNHTIEELKKQNI